MLDFFSRRSLGVVVEVAHEIPEKPNERVIDARENICQIYGVNIIATLWVR